MARRRIDSLMVERGLVETRAKAQALLMAGRVLVDGRTVTKAGALVAEEAQVRLKEGLPYVSRGGTKLAHALDHFHVDTGALVAADIGSSTGGFTDCLLQRGACRVYAIDVGRGQLDYRLRRDPRVVVLEGVNARYPLGLPERAGLAVVDVSFISATRVIPSATAVLEKGGHLLVLVKPQFEARRPEVGKGGVVKDPLVHARVLARFIIWAVDHGHRFLGLTPSPIVGASGNREFFVLLKPSRSDDG
jgi:23S rRNA (cytidine1920-2'-O)/16S rRNA (cytidine1409-2'-O)-methyltransferase